MSALEESVSTDSGKSRTNRIALRASAGFAAVATAFAFVLMTAPSAYAADVTLGVVDANDLLHAFADASAGENVTAILHNEVDISSTAFVLTDGTLTLDLAGNNLSVTAPAGGTALTIDSGATLQIIGGAQAIFTGGDRISRPGRHRTHPKWPSSSRFRRT